MPAKKRAAAKKTAAPEPEQTLVGVGTIEASGSVGVSEAPTEPEPAPPEQDRLGAFPLAEGHYFHPQVVVAAAHYGDTEVDRANLRLLQAALDVPGTGVYDDTTERAVLAWKEARGLPLSPIVGAEEWRKISAG